MKIINSGRGIHQREIPGIDKLRTLPGDWIAFTNLDLSLPKGSREIDVVMIIDDRILLIDLKDWRGQITSQDGSWYQNGQYRDRSPVAKISENTRDVVALLRSHLNGGLVPRIYGLVVLTGTKDLSGIAPIERNQVLLIDNFVQMIQQPRERVTALGAVPPMFVNSLTSQEWKTRLGRFFNAQTGSFRPGTRRYGSSGVSRTLMIPPRDIPVALADSGRDSLNAAAVPRSPQGSLSPSPTAPTT